MGVECLYRRGRAGRPRGGRPPVAPVGGAPRSPEGGATGPLLPRAPSQGPRCKFEEKKMHLGPVAPHMSPPQRATGVYFQNFLKRTYIFEILIFLNIKKITIA